MGLANRQDLITYAFRKLGDPVIEINVTQEQAEDRLDDALQTFTEFHSEGVERTYVKHKITGSHLQLTTATASTFTATETITGSVSGATMVLYDTPEINKLRTRTLNGTFIVGETVTGSVSGSTGIIAANGVFIGDIQNKYITVPNEVASITKIVTYDQSKSSGSYMFDAQYQIMLNDVFNLNSAGIDYYTMVQQHMSLLDFTLNVQPSLTFSRASGKVTIGKSWDTYSIDSYLMIECYVTVVNGSNTKIFDDFWLKKYYTAILKRQWAGNVGKYDNMILPGNMTIAAGKLWEQADAEIKELETQLKDTYQAPIMFMVG